MSTMDGRFLLDLSHTSHTHARTGIQRVARALHEELGSAALPITHDPFEGRWRPLQAWERTNLATTAPAQRRGSQWPLTARMGGRVRRMLGAREGLPANSGLIAPEVFSPAAAAALPALFAACGGPRVAVFHDAIPLQYPEFSAPKTVARFPAYLVELLAFDGIAAVSESSATALREYWEWLEAPKSPPVRTISLGVDLPAARPIAPERSGGDSPVVLTVGSIEARKNHLALLEGCERLWDRGDKFTLRLIGLAHPQTGRAALERIRQLQAAGRPLRYDGPVGDAELAAAYQECAFTVYPSLVEGFGLPVIESLAHGKPCVCSAHGPVGESARGGGTVTLAKLDAESLSAAITRLLANPGELAALAAAARGRRFRTWKEYGDDLSDWLAELKRDGSVARSVT